MFFFEKGDIAHILLASREYNIFKKKKREKFCYFIYIPLVTSGNIIGRFYFVSFEPNIKVSSSSGYIYPNTEIRSYDFFFFHLFDLRTTFKIKTSVNM